MSRFKKGNTVVVLGGGPIGTLVALVLKDYGAEKLFITEQNKYRIQVCRSLELNTIDVNVENPEEVILDHTDGNGVDLV